MNVKETKEQLIAELIRWHLPKISVTAIIQPCVVFRLRKWEKAS
mgnify:CR=1 FL=1